MSSWNKIADCRKLMTAAVVLAVLAAGPAVFGEKDWKAEFDDICSHTDQVMTLSKEEIGALIERCDRLRPSIDQLDESLKKVYLRRLQLCRNLYAFALDSLKDK